MSLTTTQHARSTHTHPDTPGHTHTHTHTHRHTHTQTKLKRRGRERKKEAKSRNQEPGKASAAHQIDISGRKLPPAALSKQQTKQTPINWINKLNYRLPPPAFPSSLSKSIHLLLPDSFVMKLILRQSVDISCDRFHGDLMAPALLQHYGSCWNLQLISKLRMDWWNGGRLTKRIELVWLDIKLGTRLAPCWFNINWNTCINWEEVRQLVNQ